MKRIGIITARYLSSSSSAGSSSSSPAATTTRFRGYERHMFHYWLPIQTRWSDNDVYGHVNNVQYLSYFDTTVNHFLFHKALSSTAFTKMDCVGLCVHSSCDYFRSLEYPDIVEVGLFVSKASRSSIKYELGVFKKDSPDCAAHGQFVHVYVDAVTRRPVEVPKYVREALTPLIRHIQ